MPDIFVLDAFALMAYLQDEPGRPRVEEVLREAASGACEVFMSAINLGEVAYNFERRRGLIATVEVLSGIDRTPISVVEVGRRMALQAARLKANHSLGFADCIAAALARELTATLLTGDRDFVAVQGFVPIEWLPLSTA